MVSRCPACGFENPPGLKFCGDCGARFGAEAGAERRRLTILFCDLVGSTALSDRLDPEALRELVRTYQTTCGEVITRLGGYIAQYLGDGILAYFGYPAARGQDASRAVRAALEILQAAAQGSVRIGIHTGLVVVGEMGRERLAMGLAPNIAARLQGEAEPGTILLSDATRRLVVDEFELEALGARALKGLSAPMAVWRVAGLRQTTGAQRTPFVGRMRELRRLGELMDAAAAGSGRTILLAGQAGIGKTRLVEALRRRSDHIESEWLICQCSPYHTGTALHPVLSALQRRCEKRLDVLETLFERFGISRAEAIPVFAPLLSIPLEERYEDLDLLPTTVRKRVQETFISLVRAMANEQTTVIVVDDLHWADPSTVELLRILIARTRDVPVVVVISYRPPFEPALGQDEDDAPVQIALGRLSSGESRSLLGRLVDEQKTVPDDVLRQIVERADGVPLFLEELTRMVLESEASNDLGTVAIPATLHDSLMARLDRLGPERELAQLAAVIGREVPVRVLAAVAELEPQVFEARLSRLAAADILRPVAAADEETYAFSQDLVRKAAGESLLESRRRSLHAQVARLLRERFGDIASEHPEVVARHCTEGRMFDEAVDHWQEAATTALRRSANLEAVEHLQRGLALLGELPEDADRFERELELTTALGPALAATRGYAHPDVQKAWRRARKLCKQAGRTPRLFQALRGLWSYYTVRSEHEHARRLAEHLMQLGDALGDRAVLAVGFQTLGTTDFYQGRFEHAAANLRSSLDLIEPGERARYTRAYGQDPVTVASAYLAWSQWYLGDATAAFATMDAAALDARERGHDFSLAFALTFGATLHAQDRNVEAARERVDECLALSAAQGFPLWMGICSIYRGWIIALEGRLQAGLDQLGAGLDRLQATGARLGTAMYTTLMADACLAAQDTAHGHEVVDRGLAFCHDSTECWNEAELIRQRGELHKMDGEVEQAEACFRRALDLAREQGCGALAHRALIQLDQLGGGA